MSSWEAELALELSNRRREGVQGEDSRPEVESVSRTEAAEFAAVAPAGYQDTTSPAEAARDLIEIKRLLEVDQERESSGPSVEIDQGTADSAVFGSGHRLVVRPATDPKCSFRLRRYGQSGMELTRTLPVLESFGLVVIESVPFRLTAPGHGDVAVYIDDIGIRTDAPYGPEALRFVPEIHGPRLVDALEAIARGDSDIDSINRLVTVAGFDWRQVSVIRALLRYRLQSGSSTTWSQLADPLAQHPDVARALIGYFLARFDPSVAPAGAEGPTSSPDSVAHARALCLAQLNLVTELGQYEVLRGYLQLVDATLRTNYFRRTDSTLVLKFDSQSVPDLPAPRPKVEAFVSSPRVEGVHLRAGLIARGGLRWSERPGDFRTEVLDLAFAQVKKNAIIVPTGAKGGFVCRGSTGRPSPETVQAAYREFVAGLLDITDNLVHGAIVHPPDVVALDGPDPYLVVAADKGTATFSDLANSISESVDFWLGDAFASGGSRGYDHKAMGITARGAWVAVRRHFRELGLDVQSDPIRVVGVGDMSGDVFGNGMLQSRSIQLLAAYDHRHVFLDPDPDPETAYEERARLFALPRSSWDDYRKDLISPGGGVWSRQTKEIPISAAARARLGIEAEVLSPPELISSILSAPVDLLFFGGIGTYIKAPDEPDVDVADHDNDAIRVTSDHVRARVIAEGANLGITQRARIRYSRRGGRINADFIDNAAGVATSDREVNLKILLALAIDRGQLDPADRDSYLSRDEQEVAHEVLRSVDHSVAALNRAAMSSAWDLDAYEALIDRLEAAGRFDRSVEVLPGSEEIQVRRAAGAGLIRPELAVILAYAKSDLVLAIEGVEAVNDPAYTDAVVPYFPLTIRESFGELIRQHRLYPQLVATGVAGEIVDRLGIVWAHETSDEMGRELAEVAAAFWAARRVVGADRLWNDLESLASGISAEAETALHGTVSRAVADLARYYLRQPGPIELGALLERDLPLLADLETHSGAIESRSEQETLVGLGVAESVAGDYTLARTRSRVGVVGTITRATGCTSSEAVQVLDGLSAVAGLGRLVGDVQAVIAVSPPPERFRVWHSRALLDEIDAWSQSAAIKAIGDSGPGNPDSVAFWAQQHANELASAASLVAAPRPAGSDPLALVSLVLRRLERSIG